MFDLILNRRTNLARTNRLGSRGNYRISSIPAFAEIQLLERRVVPSTVTWTGGGGNTNWDTAANWSGGVVPSAGSDVVIAVSSGTAVNGSGNAAQINSLTLNSGRLTLQSDLLVINGITVSSGAILLGGNYHTLTTNGNLNGKGTIDLTNDTLKLTSSLTETTSTPTLVLSGSTLKGAGTLTISAGITQNVSSSAFNIPLVNQGNLLVVNLGNQNTPFNGPFSNAGMLTLQTATNGDGQISVASGFTNSGKIVLSASTSQTATLSIDAGGLLNTSSGVIICQGTGQINLGADLTNQGSVTVNTSTMLEYYTGGLTNSGTITLNAPTTLEYNNNNGSLTNSGTIYVNAPTTSNFGLNVNSGTINVAAGKTLGFGNYETFATSGTLTGQGTIDLTNDTFKLTNSLTETTSTPAVLLSGTTVSGAGTLTISAGITQSVSSSTFNAALVNRGTLSVLNLGDYRSNFNGSFSNAGTLNLQTATNNDGEFLFSSGFTNSGKIVLSASTSQTATLSIDAGGLFNASRGVIICQGTGQINLGADLTNQGTVTVNASTTLEYYTGGLTNGGTINLNAATTLEYNNNDGSLINSGTINVNAAATSNFTVNINSGTINIATGQTFTYQSIVNVGTINTGVNPATAADLGILQAPTTATAGTPAGTVKVAVYDHYGHLESTSTSVTLTLASGKFSNGQTSVTGTTTGGIALFTGLTFNTARAYTVNVTSGTLLPQSFSINVKPAAATHLVFTSVPSTGVHGQVLSAVSVAVEDAFGNIVTGDSSSVTLSVNSSNPAGGGFDSSSTTTVKVVNGIAVFTNLKLNKAGTYTLKAVDGGLTPAISGNIVVS